MRKLLVALNVLLILAILGVAFFWHPEPAELPTPKSWGATFPSSRQRELLPPLLRGS
jgi:hypothetical protein